jgi:predicted O-methyltransferase YrrM
VIFPKKLTEMGLMGSGVEIGVWIGWHAELILKNWAGRILYAVDPWHCDAGKQHEMDNRFRSTTKRLSAYGDRCRILRTDSVSASARFEDESLDWAYIDGRHDYEGVKEDIEHWLPKVRPGGILAGHDYVERDAMWPEVKQAVDELLSPVSTWPEAQTWYVIT